MLIWSVQKMITKLEAISFLKEHQPMPGDDELTEYEIGKYEEVRNFFLNNVDAQCIPLFLNLFGGKDGLGVYQMVEDVILMYDKKEVLPHMLKAFNNPCKYVIYWCVQIASNFPDKDLFTPLTAFMKHDDEDIQIASITTLAQLALNDIRSYEVIDVLKNEIEIASDEEVKEFIQEVLEDILEDNK